MDRIALNLPLVLHPEALMRARSVAIVVHGVGDHTETDILSELLTGLQNSISHDPTAPRYSATRQQVDMFPLPDGTIGLQEAMLIEVGGFSNFLLPVVWSHLRLRSNEEIQEGDRTGRMASPIPHVEAIAHLVSALPALIAIPFYCLRCVPKAIGLWKVGVLLAACGVLGIEAGFIWESLRILNSGTANVEVINGFLFVNLFKILLPGFVGLAIVKLSLPILDYVGDVVEYVGRPKHRDRLETRMAEIIDFVVKQAPDADVLVVGHSLGSILIIHCLLRKARWSLGPRRLILLTLGSPLKLLSRVFPKSILNPGELTARYAQDGFVPVWFNLWRSHDLIGRSLGTTTIPTFSESCLGGGGHTNYWRDLRLWQKVLSLMNLA